MKKKLFSFILALIACVGIANAQSGTCGTDVTWNFSNNTLTISGTGEMFDLQEQTKQPWFNYNSQIFSVVIKNGVTAIGDLAFCSFKYLTSVTIPNTVTRIGNSAFVNCPYLPSITIPNSVTTIESNAFNNCKKLSSIIIPNSVISIGNRAFYQTADYNNTSNWKNGVFYISNCLLEAKTTISGSYAIQEATRVIASSAFSGCSSLISVSVPNGVTNIGELVFNNCSSLTSIDVANDNPGYCSIDGVLFNKDKTTLIKYPAKHQGTEYTIPANVMSIGEWAFYDCTLSSVTFEGQTPPTIGEYAFKSSSNCLIYVPCGTKETYVAALNKNNTIDESLVVEKLMYNYSVVSANTSLGTVSITKEPTSCEENKLSFRADAIEGYYFVNWSDGNKENPRELAVIADITLSAEFAENYDAEHCQITYTSTDGKVVTPHEITGFGATIVSNAYENGIGIITFDGPIKSIGETAFANCSTLTSIVIPDRVTNIASQAFLNCAKLANVTIGNRVESIGRAAFNNCYSLRTITIPQSVKYIYNAAFVGASLSSIYVNRTTPPTLNPDREDPYYVLGIDAVSVCYIPCGSLASYQASEWKTKGQVREFVEQALYTLNVTTADASMGSATITEELECQTLTATISATANEGYHFVQWSDGNTDNPRTLTITADTELTAEFAADEVETEQYTRSVTPNTYGTICIPFGSNDFSGATFYEIAYKAPLQIYFDEVTTLEAGKPYIYYAHSNQIVINSNGTKVDNPFSNINGLYGVFTEIAAAVGNLLTGNYIINSNMLRLCGDNCSLPANRAYVILKDVPETARPLAPGRQRVGMSLQDENTTTALDNITEDIQSNGVQEGTFDVLGRRLLQPTGSGFYIINGKKVIVTK